MSSEQWFGVFLFRIVFPSRGMLCVFRFVIMIAINLTTNFAAVVWMCVSVQNLTNFCPHALISNPHVPKMLFA